MPIPTQEQKRQGNLYDKIFRENMQEQLPGIMEHVLHLDAEILEEIKDDIQFTKERRADLLRKVRAKDGEVYILHIEYQAKNSLNMHYRMAEYNIMLQRKFSLPIHQYVVFVGQGKATMPTEINSRNMKFCYDMASLSEVDYKLFLNLEKIEEKMLAVLGDVENYNQKSLLTDILRAINKNSKDDLTASRYIQQLYVLVNLRKLALTLDEVMESVTTFFKEEKQPMFKRGEQKGGYRKAIEIARKMKKEGFSLEQIIKFTELSDIEIKDL